MERTDTKPIAEMDGWSIEPPTINCFVLLKTPEFPKNCEYVVAEWDNDAKCFYSEATDYPIKLWYKWMMIEERGF